MYINVAKTEYRVAIYHRTDNGNSVFRKFIDVFDKFNKAVAYIKDYDELLAENEYLDIDKIEYDNDGNEYTHSHIYPYPIDISKTEYAVEIYSVNDNDESKFSEQVDVFGTFDEAVACIKAYDEPLAENEYLDITEISYDENDNEIDSVSGLYHGKADDEEQTDDEDDYLVEECNGLTGLNLVKCLYSLTVGETNEE